MNFASNLVWTPFPGAGLCEELNYLFFPLECFPMARSSGWLGWGLFLLAGVAFLRSPLLFHHPHRVLCAIGFGAFHFI